MDEKDIRAAGSEFRVGDDLYGVSLAQLNDRIDVLRAEITRIQAKIEKKSTELNAAEDFFKKS